MSGRYVVGLAVVVGCLVPLATAADLTVDYTFARPTMSQVHIAGVTYDRISMPDAPNGGKAGQPHLPVGGAKILIPYGDEVVGVEVTGGRMLIGSGYRIEPVGKPYPLSVGPTAENIPQPNEQIYGSATPFPAQRFSQVGTYGFRGYEILYLRLEPTEYIPATGELYYYPHLQVTVRTAATGHTNSLFRGLTEDARQAAKKVDNPVAVETYPATRGTRNYDLLIITTSNYQSAFQPLVDAHNANGTPTQILTLSSGTSWTTIRHDIRDAYNTDGIRFVLIGAGDNVFEAPNLYTDDGSSGYTEYNMPSDFYYGCLDGEYDPSDHYDLDLVGEVYVGRAAADSTAEVTNFVNKTVAYMHEEHEHLDADLQAGEWLGFGSVSEYASGCMDQLVDGGTFDGYATIGIPSSLFSIDRLYDAPGYDWPVSQIINRMNAGVHWINHLGHGNQTYGLKMYTSDVQNLTNTDYFFIFSQACDCGWFDGYECIAEYFTTKTSHGAFAVIMNARYGWGEFDSTDGPSQRFHRWFWDGVFNPDVDERYYYGAANQYSKEMNIPRLEDDCTRYCFYELNLLGDPSVEIIGAQRPIKIKLPSTLPAIVDPDVPTTITVQIDPGGEEYVADTGVLNYRINGGAFETIPLEATADEEVYQATLPATGCGSTLEYYFSATGTETGEINLPQSAPTDLFRTYVATYVNVMTDDFETDQGWTVWNDPSLTGGAWQRAVPITPPTQGAPNADFDGSGECFVTGNFTGEFCDVDFGPTILISPAFNLVGLSNPMIHYARWVYCDDFLPPSTDYLNVQLSADGTNWVTAEHVTALGQWAQHEIRVRDFVPLTSTVQVRFSVKDTPNNSYTECGVDAVEVYDLYCPSTLVPGDLNCDGVVNGYDIDPFVLALTDLMGYATAYPDCDYMQADINGDGTVNGYDIDPFVELLLR
jgi:hypothetical protein